MDFQQLTAEVCYWWPWSPQHSVRHGNTSRKDHSGVWKCHQLNKCTPLANGVIQLYQSRVPQRLRSIARRKRKSPFYSVQGGGSTPYIIQSILFAFLAQQVYATKCSTCKISLAAALGCVQGCCCCFLTWPTPRCKLAMSSFWWMQQANSRDGGWVRQSV